jgi:hypothetical protein
MLQIVNRPEKALHKVTLRFEKDPNNEYLSSLKTENLMYNKLMQTGEVLHG